MSDVAISIERLSKAYLIGLQEEAHETLTGTMMSWVRAPLRNLRQLRRLNTFGRTVGDADAEHGSRAGGRKQSDIDERDILWALRDVSFEVLSGEVVGIIGRNGAGKSTLLKILSRITDPTSGQAVIRGRVSSLLEVGTGFHPELSGRENVYMNGTILGMRKREIDRKFDAIAAFSGVERMLDTPVKRYSSGQKVRLAFAVAAHLEPEILIIDEVLAVGDVEFQAKCLGKMNEVATSGRTVLFVSHNMAAVESLCSHGILLENGRLAANGEITSVLRKYQAAINDAESSTQSLQVHSGRPAGTAPLMRRVVLRDGSGHPSSSFPMGEGLHIEVEYSGGRSFSPVLGVVVKTQLGAAVFGVDNRIVGGYQFEEAQGGVIACRIDSLPLMPGQYMLDLYLGDRQQSIDRVEGAISFSVTAADVFGSGKLPPAHCGPVWSSANWVFTDADQKLQTPLACR